MGFLLSSSLSDSDFLDLDFFFFLGLLFAPVAPPWVPSACLLLAEERGAFGLFDDAAAVAGLEASEAPEAAAEIGLTLLLFGVTRPRGMLF